MDLERLPAPVADGQRLAGYEDADAGRLHLRRPVYLGLAVCHDRDGYGRAPSIVVFIFLQKYIVKGVVAGAVKG